MHVTADTLKASEATVGLAAGLYALWRTAFRRARADRIKRRAGRKAFYGSKAEKDDAGNVTVPAIPGLVSQVQTLAAVVATMAEQMTLVTYEMSPNKGGSIKDRMAQVVAAVGVLTERQATIADTAATVAARAEEIAAAQVAQVQASDRIHTAMWAAIVEDARHGGDYEIPRQRLEEIRQADDRRGERNAD